jgi:hypothetical protein
MATERIIAMLNRAEGNESIGEMWIETRSFPSDTPVSEIVAWARSKREFGGNILRNLRIQFDEAADGN